MSLRDCIPLQHINNSLKSFGALLNCLNSGSLFKDRHLNMHPKDWWKTRSLRSRHRSHSWHSCYGSQDVVCNITNFCNKYIFKFCNSLQCTLFSRKASTTFLSFTWTLAGSFQDLASVWGQCLNLQIFLPQFIMLPSWPGTCTRGWWKVQRKYQRQELRDWPELSFPFFFYAMLVYGQGKRANVLLFRASEAFGSYCCSQPAPHVHLTRYCWHHGVRAVA